MSPTSLSDPSISINICASTPPHRHQVATSPESCGDRVVVVSSPYKSHTHSRASIQVGQHHLKPFAATVGPSSRVTKSDVGRNSTPPPLCTVVLQPCSFGSRCAGWVTRSVRISIIHPHTPVLRFLASASVKRMHEQTVEDLFQSSVVAAPTAIVG